MLRVRAACIRDRAVSMRKTGLSVTAIIVAAGSGSRFGSSTPKQFLLLGDKPVLFHSVQLLAGLDVIEELILVVPRAHVAFVRNNHHAKATAKPLKVVAGGERRQDSVYRGLRCIAASADIVLIHDGVRPFVPVAAVKRAISSARRFGAAVLACPAMDTVKIASADRGVIATMPRKTIWLAQTPQVFRTELILRAYEEVMRAGLEVSDDAAAVEAVGGRVKLIVGLRENLKITTQKDFRLAQQILAQRTRAR
jgi:2-C-methyl-D-erythritol 4-phosphate cytidylyltransferase